VEVDLKARIHGGGGFGGGGFHGGGRGAQWSLTQSGMTVRFAGFVDLTTVLR